MDSLRQGFQASGMSRGVGGVAVLILGAIGLYYLYQYLFTASGLATASLITTAIPANTTTDLYPIPLPYEGGEYSVSCWFYITAYKDAVGQKKHILEIRGATSSTLVIGLDSYTSKLLVRVGTNKDGSPTLSKDTITQHTSLCSCKKSGYETTNT